MIAGCDDGGVHAWRLSDMEHGIIEGHTAAVWSVASVDSFLLTGSSDGIIKVSGLSLSHSPVIAQQRAAPDLSGELPCGPGPARENRLDCVGSFVICVGFQDPRCCLAVACLQSICGMRCHLGRRPAIKGRELFQLLRPTFCSFLQIWLYDGRDDTYDHIVTVRSLTGGIWSIANGTEVVTAADDEMLHVIVKEEGNVGGEESQTWNLVKTFSHGHRSKRIPLGTFLASSFVPCHRRVFRKADADDRMALQGSGGGTDGRQCQLARHMQPRARTPCQSMEQKDMGLCVGGELIETAGCASLETAGVKIQLAERPGVALGRPCSLVHRLLPSLHTMVCLQHPTARTQLASRSRDNHTGAQYERTRGVFLLGMGG